MSDIRFTRDHEWIRVENGEGTVGITDYAQKQLGDVVFVELPDTGKHLKQGDEAAVVESVKAAAEVYAPVEGTVSVVNDRLAQTPDMVNSDPMGAGWFLRLQIVDDGHLAELMDEAAYRAYLATLE